MAWFRSLVVAPFQIFRQCLITDLRCSIVRWCRTGQSIKEQTKRLQVRRLCFCCQANVERSSPMVEIWRVVKYVCPARLWESCLRRCRQRRRIPVFVKDNPRWQRRWFDCSITTSTKWGKVLGMSTKRSPTRGSWCALVRTLVNRGSYRVQQGSQETPYGVQDTGLDSSSDRRDRDQRDRLPHPKLTLHRSLSLDHLEFGVSELPSAHRGGTRSLQRRRAENFETTLILFHIYVITWIFLLIGTKTLIFLLRRAQRNTRLRSINLHQGMSWCLLYTIRSLL